MVQLKSWLRSARLLKDSIAFLAIFIGQLALAEPYSTKQVDDGYVIYFACILLTPIAIFIAFLILQFWSSLILERALSCYTEHFSKEERVFAALGGLCRAILPLAMTTAIGFYCIPFLANKDFNTILAGTLSSMLFLQLLVMAVLSPYIPRARLFQADEIYVRSVWRFFRATLWIFGTGIITTSGAEILLDLPKEQVILIKHSFAALIISYLLLSVFRARMAIKNILDSTYKDNGVWISIFCAINKRWGILFGCGSLFLLGAEFCVLDGISYAHWIKPMAYGLIGLAGTQIVVACALQLLSKIRCKLEEKHTQNDIFLQRVKKNISHIESLTIATLYTVLILILCHFYGLSIIEATKTPWGHFFLISCIGNVFLVCLGIVLYQALTLLVDYKIALVQTQNIEKEKRLRTFLPLLRSVIHVAIFFLIIAGIIENLGFSITPLVAGFSVLSLAISFGAQEVTKSFIQGTIVLIEDDMDTGDYVTINGISGFVERMSIRAVYVREISGTLHIIPYSVVNAFCNLSRDYTLQIYELTVDPHEHVSRVIQALEEVGQEMLAEEVYQKQIIEPVQVFGVTPFDRKGVTVLWAIKTHPDPLKLVGFEFYKRLKQKFDVMGINVPAELYKIYTAEDQLFASQRRA
ncbi:MAG: mechanosensitive ion channel [Holosporales bacterium]|jgi:small conductance mechanosensitive channel|nr:mechanosensitive ion channel [Holosporales bacterium]